MTRWPVPGPEYDMAMNAWRSFLGPMIFGNMAEIESDRECIAATNNYLAVCNQRTSPPECVVTCARDSECAELHALWICVDSVCADPGCETDEECRAVFAEYAGLDTGMDAVCRERESP